MRLTDEQIIKCIPIFERESDRKLLELRYIEKRSLSAIAELMNYTYQYTKTRHSHLVAMIRFRYR